MAGAGADDLRPGRRPVEAMETALVGCLALVIETPAFNRAGPGEGAGVIEARAKLHKGARLVARLTGVVVAPAVGRAAQSQGAGVGVAGAHLAVRAKLAGCLAIAIEAPALDRAGWR